MPTPIDIEPPSTDAEVAIDPEKLMARFRDPVWGAGKLKDITLFGRFTDQELARIYAIGKLVKLLPQINAVIEGEPSRGLYIILHGKVSVYKTDQVSGNLTRLALLEDGANFGELSLFDAAPRSATVMTETVCYLFQLDADVFNAFLNQAEGDVALRFYRTCAEELATRFRRLNGDYLTSQQMLWKYALRRSDTA